MTHQVKSDDASYRLLTLMDDLLLLQVHQLWSQGLWVQFAGGCKASARCPLHISIYCLVEMERYWLAVLVAFLILSSANGAALTGPGENGGSSLCVVSGF